MGRETHDPTAATKPTLWPRRVNRDVVHPALKTVFHLCGASPHSFVARVVAEDDVEPLLLTREESRVQQIKVAASNRRVLEGPDDEILLQPNWVVRVAFTAL